MIKVITYVTDETLYYLGERELNLGILEILEKEGIDRLHVDLVTSLQSDREIMKSVSNSNSVLKKN